jgi:hypothetical protein
VSVPCYTAKDLKLYIYSEKHVAYRTFKDVKLLINDIEELPFTISPILLHMNKFNKLVFMISLIVPSIKGTGEMINLVLTNLSILLDWTNFLELVLQTNFLGISYKFINFVPNKSCAENSICHLNIIKGMLQITFCINQFDLITRRCVFFFLNHREAILRIITNKIPQSSHMNSHREHK